MPNAGTNGNRVTDKSDKLSWFAVPWDVAGRVGLLFVTLCALKLVMLIGFRKHLFEIHWRVGSESYDWTNEAAFWSFAVLVGVNLWQFARRCADNDKQTIRAANIIVLLIGACFIFLTFHAGDKNYLYPVMNGTLSWWDLRWYLSMDFFFHPPFLGAWIFIYAGLYYFLVRTKREQLILYFTAIFAAVYVGLCLRDLVQYRDALMTADGLGIACFLAGINFRGSLKWFTVIQPWLWFIFFFFLFWSQDDLQLGENPEVVMFCAWSIVFFAGLTIFAGRRKLMNAWLWLLPFALVSFLFFVNTNYPAAVNYRNLLFTGLTLPRYFLDEFFIALVLTLMAMVYRRWLPKGSLLWLDAINLILIVLAVVDLRLSQLMGIRLDWQAIAFGANTKMVLRLAKPYLPELTVGLVVLTGLYAVLIGLWRRETAFKSLPVGRGGSFLIVAFLLLGFVGNKFDKDDKAKGQSAILLAETSPLFSKTINVPLDKNAFLKIAGELGMEQMTRPFTSAPMHAPRDLNVVLIFQESSYNKHLSLFDGTENTEPLLSKYKDRMELFPNFFSSYAASVNARFATLAGLYPARDYKQFTFHRVDVKSIYDVLAERGYHCSVFDSCFFDYSGFRDFLQGRGIEAMYDADTMPGQRTGQSVSWGLPEKETLMAIQAQIKQYETNHQKFFLSYFPVAPHNPFDGTPAEFRKHSIKVPGDFTPLYLDELLYMDWIIASILDELKDTGLLEHTLVIITDDHGEMLGENGGPIGHGWAITPQLANVPLIIMDPDRPGYRVNDTIGSQVDLLPTTLDLLGISLPQNQLYQGVSLYSAAAQNDRMIYLNSFQQYGIVEDHRFICGSRETENSNTNALTAFAIANAGARTLFPPTNSPAVSLPAIGQFDAFQENLLQNYSYYCQLIKGNNQ